MFLLDHSKGGNLCADGIGLVHCRVCGSQKKNVPDIPQSVRNPFLHFCVCRKLDFITSSCRYDKTKQDLRVLRAVVEYSSL